ncbi:MAG: heavy metal translocating P-type ATPase [Oscillospiraceae bacterium]|nr:heavy metal translocating P-type ATPase [Oscillospiraceae bacterium]
MAKHLVQETEIQETRRPQPHGRALAFGSVKLPELSQLMHIRKRRARYAKSYVREFSMQVILLILAAVLLFILVCAAPVNGLPKLVGYALSAAVAAFPLVQRLVAKVIDRKMPDEDLLVLIAVITVFCLGEYAPAACAMILYRISELLESFVLAGGEGAAENFRDLLPEKARLETADGPVDTVPEALSVGDVVRVLPHELFPADGIVLEGRSQGDFSSLTGDEALVTLSRGSAVYAGCVNEGSELLVQTTEAFESCAMAARLKTLSKASQTRTRLEKLLTRISSIYVPVLAVLALLIGVAVPLSGGVWKIWLHRAAVLLLLSSPSALLLSVPLAFRGAVFAAAEHGVRIEEEETISELARTRTMVFGKTGTITAGEYTITDVCPDGVEARDLLTIAAAAESYSRHPIAVALKRAAGWTAQNAQSVLEVEELPGRGVSAFIEGRHVYVGNAALLEEHGIWYKVPARAGAAIHVAVENIYWGHIMVSDKPRENAFDALEELRMLGVSNMVMLTGDVLSVSRPIASSLNFDMVKAELSPEAKVNAIEYLLSSKGDNSRLCYVGDGIHDAALREKADLGAVIHGLRAEKDGVSADVCILGNDIQTLPLTMRICAAAYRIAWINTFAFAAVKLVLLILALAGALPVLGAAIAEAVVTVLAMFHALRAFGTR